MNKFSTRNFRIIFSLTFAVILAFATVFTLQPLKSRAEQSSDGTKDLIVNEEFSYDSANHWTSAQGFKSNIGNAGNSAVVAGLMLDAKIKSPNTGADANAETSTVLYTKPLTAPYTIDMGIYFSDRTTDGNNGTLMILIGGSKMSASYETGGDKIDCFGINSRAVAKKSYPSSGRTDFSTDMKGKTLRMTINATTATAATVRVRDENGADLLADETQSLELANCNGYFGVSTDLWIDTESIITYARIESGAGIVYDNFTSEATFATNQNGSGDYAAIDPSEANRIWATRSASGTQNVSRHVRIVRGNELILGKRGSATELVWMDQPMIGGIGASYTVKFDHRNIEDAWHGEATALPKLAIVMNAKATGFSKGIAAAAGVANTRTQFPGLYYLGDGTQVGIIGTGTEVTESLQAEVSHDTWGDLQQVTVKMSQTAAALTTVEISYYNAKTAKTYAGTFAVAQPIGGYFTMIAHNPEVISNFRMYDKDGAMISASEFEGVSENGSVTSAFNWFIGKDSTSTDTFALRGATTSKALVVSSNAGNDVMIANDKIVVTEVVEGFAAREKMFESTIKISQGGVNFGNGTFSVVFGAENNAYNEATANRVEFTGTKMIAWKGTVKLGEKEFALTADGATITFSALSSGVLMVTSQTNVFNADYEIANAFAGKLGFAAKNNAVVRIDSFELEMLGVRDYAKLSVTPHTVVAVGKPVSFLPDDYSDAADAKTELTLNIYVKTGDGAEIKLGANGSHTFTQMGLWSVRYELINTAGLTTKHSYTFFARYLGTDENKVDVLRNNFTDGLGSAWSSAGTVSATGGTVTIGASSSVETIGTMPYFTMYFTINSLDGDIFEITFGNCFDYTSSFGIIFTKGATSVSLRNLSSATAEITGGFDIFDADGAEIKLVVMGDSINISARRANGSYDQLRENILTASFAKDLGMTYGKIGFKTQANTTAALKDVRLYSLDSDISIDAENAPAEVVEPTVDGKKGLSVGAIVGIVLGSVAAAALIAVGIVLIIKKRGKKA